MSMDAVGTKANTILLSCNMLYFHFCWGLFMILIGAVAIVSRLAVKPLRKWLRPWHATLGQAYMYGMIVQISTSLYCRQDGFRPFIYGFPGHLCGPLHHCPLDHPCIPERRPEGKACCGSGKQECPPSSSPVKRTRLPRQFCLMESSTLQASGWRVSRWRV